MALNHHPRAFAEIARPRIIAKPGPGLHEIVGIGPTQLFNRRPERKKTGEIGFDRFDRRLLQHHFRQPDMVGVGPDACLAPRWWHAPWQVAMVGVIPVQQARGDLPCR